MGDLSRRRPYISIHIYTMPCGKKRKHFYIFLFGTELEIFERANRRNKKIGCVRPPSYGIFLLGPVSQRSGRAIWRCFFILHVFFFCWLVFVLLLSFLIYFVLFSPLSRSFSGLNPTHYQERKSSSSAETHCLCFISLILVGDYELNRRKLLRLLLLVVIEK